MSEAKKGMQQMPGIPEMFIHITLAGGQLNVQSSVQDGILFLGMLEQAKLIYQAAKLKQGDSLIAVPQMQI